MHRVTQALPGPPEDLPLVRVPVDRHKLARRRWRGEAEDGTDFGFDLNEPLAHGDCVHLGETSAYVIEQAPEACLLLPYGEAREAGRTGWLVGNLHFKAAFAEDGMLVPDDPAVRQMLEREHLAFERVTRVFQPGRSGGHTHSHEHGHSH